MNVNEFLERVQGVKKDGEQWKARCPAHDDHDPSLAIAEGSDGRVLVTCRTGCTTETVVAALGLTTADLFYEKTGTAATKRITATYDYTSETGELLYQVVRFSPKDFRQRRPDGNGGWQWKLNGTERVLYRLPDVTTTRAAGGVVWVCEGEKDADALRPLLEPLGCCSTTMPGGVGKWKPNYTATLAGGSVIVVADRDDPGINHAARVAAELRQAGGQVDVVQSASGKDASDHVRAGLGIADFVQLPEVAQVADDAPQGANLTALQPATPYKGCSVAEQFTPAASKEVNHVADEVADPPFAVSLGMFIDKPRPTVAALVEDQDGTPFVAKYSLTFLGAKGGRGKTTWFVDWMVHLALGWDYLCFKVPAPLRILVIENEGPEHLFAEKLEARVRLLSDADAMRVREQVSVHTFDWGGFNLGDESQFAQLRGFLQSEPHDLVFGDPLDSLGVEGVGSPEDTRRFLALMKQAGLNRSNAWWLNTHPRKEETREAIDEIAGAWGGKPDTVMLLDMLEGDRSRVRFPKVRWARRGKRPSVMLGYDADTATFTYVGEVNEDERDYLHELVELLADGKWRTLKELSVKSAGGIGASDDKVKPVLSEHPDRFVSRTGPEAVEVGRNANATVWQLSADAGGAS